jgi:putative salt-induced outer membrane protein YdiY
MRHLQRSGLLALAPGLACFIAVGLARAEPTADMWNDSAELSYVTTAGNSETSTFGLKNTLRRTWDRSSFEFKLGGIRAEATTVTRIAVGPNPGNFSVIERSSASLTAENYFANGRYDRKISARFFWYGGAGWDRNRFAGIENRSTGAVGVGNIWADSARAKFRTDYALSYTKQEDVVTSPDLRDTFAGLRVTSAFEHTIGAVTTFRNDVTLDGNLRQTTRWRGEMLNALTVVMSTHLALKVGARWLYEHTPAFQSVELDNPLGTPTGQSALVELKRLDTIVTTSLVVNF